MLMRNSGRLLVFPGGLSWCIDQHSCLPPIQRHGDTTNEERPLQHFCAKELTIIQQILWYGTSEQRHSLPYTCANPGKHRTNCA